MGIDKPNIRFVLIHGLPSSIEEFYQLAGRAGRDKRIAHCLLVATEWDERETESLLADRTSFDDVIRTVKGWTPDRQFSDDLAGQLFFHRQSFAGRKREIEKVEVVLEQFDEDLSRREGVRVAFDGDQHQEKAIYSSSFSMADRAETAARTRHGRARSIEQSEFLSRLRLRFPA